MKKIYWAIYFLLFFSTQSCNFSYDSGDKQFKERYSKQVKEINKEREDSFAKNSLVNNMDNLLNPMEQEDNFPNKANNFDYVDIAHFGSNKKKYFPDYEVYEHSKLSGPESQFSPKIFEIGYNTHLNQPFSVSGVEFDFIDIPESDSFGVKSSSSNKNYTLVPIKSIQEAIKAINQSRTVDDVEFSKKIIVEKKILLRKKNLLNNDEKNDYVKLFEQASNNNEKPEKKIENSQKNLQ